MLFHIKNDFICDGKVGKMDRSYPLYDELFNTVNQRIQRNIDIQQVCSTITNLSASLSPEDARAHYREIAALIVHHDAHNNPSPYNGKTMVNNKGVLHGMGEFPTLLQQ